MPDSTTPATPSKAMVFVRRTGSTLFLWALVAGVFVSGWTWAFLGLLSLLILIATVEYSNMLRAAGLPGFPRFSLLSAIVYCVTMGWPMVNGNAAHPGLEGLAVAAVAIGVFTLQLRQPIDGTRSLLAVAAHVLGFVYMPVMFGFAARLLFITPGSFDTAGHVTPASAFLLLWLIAVTKFTDMGAYITGSLIGRHKMIPHVSPAKTWEGFGGALAFAQLAGFGLYLGFPGHLAILGGPLHVAILGLLLASLAVVGDLAESIVKRTLNAKDSGQMLPGIGGSLDLIDSICFTAPALYIYIQWFLLPPA